MKVRLLRDCDGETFPGSGVLCIHPKGTEFDYPDSHILCHRQYGNQPPLAEPIDDEAKAEHEKYMKSLETRLDELREMAADADESTAHGRHVIDLAKSYGVYEGEDE